MAVMRTLPGQQEYTVECVHRSSNAFEVAQQLDAFRKEVQELTDTKSLPPLVLRRSEAKDDEAVNLRLRSRSGSTAASDADLISTAPDLETARRELLAKLESAHSKLVFTTNSDRPGLLAEVTELIKLHGANILRAEVSSDSLNGSATHIYEVQDATTRRQLDRRSLERLEASLASLREARSPVRRAARKVSRDMTAEQLMMRSDSDIRFERAGGTYVKAAIRIVVPGPASAQENKAPNADVFSLVTEFAGLQSALKELAALSVAPSVEISYGNVPHRVVEVLGFERTGGTQVLARGIDANELLMELQTRFGTTSTIVFTSESDRPGLLYEVTELIRQHGLNIIRADVSTEQGSNRASHTYHVEDAKRKRRPSVSTLRRLQADFEVLRTAPVDVRTLLARESPESGESDDSDSESDE